MTPMPTTSNPVPAHTYTEKAQRHREGSVLLSITDDLICKLNGVGALIWMILEENPEGLSIDEVAGELSAQFEAINSEGQLRYEVSPKQLRDDTARFIKNMTEMNLLQTMTDSLGQEFYYIKEGVGGTTSATVAATGAATSMKAVPLETESPRVPLSEPSTALLYRLKQGSPSKQRGRYLPTMTSSSRNARRSRHSSASQPLIRY